ncbi:hypothetical protein ACFY20_35770 [Streptomyces sp. NPDC001312]|uniref:hypothetical protein n=1 Tax=Streptomyces sp. NPDC001312 TaxID=3364561 RepID=UPI0036B42161
MTKSDFSFDFNFDEDAIKKMANDVVGKMARDLTTALNELKPRYEGAPIRDVKSAVQAVWKKHSGGGDISDPELTEFAEQIQAGGRVEVRLG